MSLNNRLKNDLVLEGAGYESMEELCLQEFIKELKRIKKLLVEM